MSVCYLFVLENFCIIAVLKVCQNVEQLLSQNMRKSFCFRRLQVRPDSGGNPFTSDSYMAAKDMTMGFKFNEEAKAIGFQDHDMLVGYDDKTFEKFDVDLYRHIADANTVKVKRNGKLIDINMPEDMSLLQMLQADPAFARPFVPAELDSVIPSLCSR